MKDDFLGVHEIYVFMDIHIELLPHYFIKTHLLKRKHFFNSLNENMSLLLMYMFLRRGILILESPVSSLAIQFLMRSVFNDGQLLGVHVCL